MVSHARTGGNPLRGSDVPNDLGLELFHRGRGQGISLIGYHRTGIFCDAPSPWIDGYTRRTHQVATADIPELIGSGLQKLIWLTARERIAQYTPQLQAEFRDRLYVVNTEQEQLEFLNPATNKALATQVLAAKLGIPRESVLAFGDGNNDVPLLEWPACRWPWPMGASRPGARPSGSARPVLRRPPWRDRWKQIIG
ncbi:MAG: HAD hydrolase family protein [Verrucomicrobiota bacterium]